MASRIITVASFKGGVGKTTTAVHLASELNKTSPCLLVDGDLNRSAIQWSSKGLLPCEVVDKEAGIMHAGKYDQIVIDTAARPEPKDLAALAKGCNLLVVPTTPDPLAVGALQKMLMELGQLGAAYRVLITRVPPKPSKEGAKLQDSLNENGIPNFTTLIRRFAAFEKAAFAGVPVGDLKADKNHGIAAKCYQDFAKELISYV